MALTKTAHTLISRHFANRPKNRALDATCGNGHDTEFLIRLGFAQVVGIDVQARAIDATKQRLANANLPQAELIQGRHEDLIQSLGSPIDCAIFNFGYLPSADKRITTLAHTSIIAVEHASELISDAGLISILCYPGHAAGAKETDAIRSWLAKLDANWKVDIHLCEAPKPTAPILFHVARK